MKSALFSSVIGVLSVFNLFLMQEHRVSYVLILHQANVPSSTHRVNSDICPHPNSRPKTKTITS